MPDIYNIAERFRRQQLRKERAAASEMVRAYGSIWRDVNRRINDLTREYYRAMQTGQATSTSWLYQFERLQSLRAPVEAQLSQYARYAATTIQAQQWEALQAGSEHGYALLQQAAQGVDVVFNRLPANAIGYAVGFQQDGSPLVDVLNKYGKEAAQGLGDALVQGLALGQNPSVVARFARKQFGMALWEALRLARTETIRAYRAATLETYRANQDVVAGWVWMSARNERTCAMCWAMDGTFHKLDESLDDHPNGRCTQLPKIKGMPLPLRGTGVEAFEKLSDVQKLKILGPSKYAAYKDGVIKLQNLIGVKRSETWGRMFYERSLKDVLGERSTYYTGLGRKVMGHTWYSTRISPGLTTVEDARFSGNQPWGWKDYENKFMELAKKRRVSILSHERTFGIWNGSVEPSNRSEVAGRKEAVKQLARDMRKLYSQDAIAVLMPRKGAEGGILRWDFGRKLTDVELNQVLGSAREISKILDIDIPLTSRSGKLEYWFKDPEGRINGRELINLTLERVGLSAVLEKPVLGYDFILIFGR